MIPTISDYYRSAIEALRNEVEATTDADVIGRDHDDWYADLIEKHGMVPIEIDASRGEKLASVDISKPAIDLHFKTGHHARGERDGVSFTAGLPWTASLSVVWCASCAAHT